MILDSFLSPVFYDFFVLSFPVFFRSCLLLSIKHSIVLSGKAPFTAGCCKLHTESTALFIGRSGFTSLYGSGSGFNDASFRSANHYIANFIGPSIRQSIRSFIWRQDKTTDTLYLDSSFFFPFRWPFLVHRHCTSFYILHPMIIDDDSKFSYRHDIAQIPPVPPPPLSFLSRLHSPLSLVDDVLYFNHGFLNWSRPPW